MTPGERIQVNGVKPQLRRALEIARKHAEDRAAVPVSMSAFIRSCVERDPRVVAALAEGSSDE